MKIGSSHCLMWLVIQHLRKRQIETLTFGGATASDPEGLTRYKRGFRPEEVLLFHYQFCIGRPLLHKIVNVARLVRRLPRGLRR